MNMEVGVSDAYNVQAASQGLTCPFHYGPPPFLRIKKVFTKDKENR